MRTVGGVRFSRALVTLAAASLASCGGGPSDVGYSDKKGNPPTAVVTVIGHPYRHADGGGVASVTVRAQSEITLSAKDSVSGAAPILDFTFEQTDSHARIPLLSRTRNSASFTVPAIDEETTYRFRLSVRDSKDARDAADIDVHVKPIRDPNRFLTYAPTPSTFVVVATSDASLPADPGAAPDATLGEFTITVRRLLTYRDRSGVLHTDVPLDVSPNPAPVQVEGAWLTRVGANSSCLNAPENPRFEIDLPSLDEDDLNILVQSDRQRQLELADIDEAILRVELSIVSRSGSVTPQLCVLDPDNASTPKAQNVVATTLHVDQLRGSPNDALDTRASALAYYRTFGEERAKTSFFEWLAANDFDRTQADYGADVHAVYTNNFDLGFGRDMYVKVGDCDTPMIGVGTCDIAAVVINYPTLEAAAKKVGAILAVAMEYRATPLSNGRRIVKFYAYAPDIRSTTGDYKRVHSVNLDGRGEKYLPEACTVCHGGMPGGLESNGTYANGGDVNAGFLPWDLDALLFSDTDPAFSRDPADEALHARLTRSAQETELRKLNASAYVTYADPVRFVLARELIEGWYSLGVLPTTALDEVFTGTHNGAFVPRGWQATGVDGVAAGGTSGNDNDDNPADASSLYLEVFGPYCRSCHTLHVPNPLLADIRESSLCDAERPISEPSVGAGRQRPMGCYWQMVGDPQFASRLAAGTMPLSRLTMDRFWVGAAHDQAVPASDRLNAHLESVLGASALIPTPGTPSASFEVQFVDASGRAQTEALMDIGHYVELNARDARFVHGYEWTVARCSQPGLADTCTSSIAVSNRNAARASARLEQTGEYRVELSINGRTEAIASQTFTVPERSPQLAEGVNKDFSIGASAPLSDLLVSLGNGSVEQHRISIMPGSSQLIVEPVSCVAPSSCDATTPTVLSSTSLVPLTSSVTFSVRDLNDTMAAEATYPISVVSTITAGDRTICTQANSSGANLTSQMADCVDGTGQSGTIDLLQLNSAAFGARTDLGIEFPNGTQMDLRNFDGGTGTLTLAASGSPARTRFVSYAPPLRFATHSRTGGVGLLNDGAPVFDAIQYRIVRYDEGGSVVEQSSTATLRFQINARTSFAADAMPVFTTQGCTLAGCHDGSMPNRPNYNQSPEQVLAIFRGAGGSYPTMINSVGGQPRAYVIPSQVASTLASSGLLCWPTNTCSSGMHSGGAFTPAQVQALRAWIEDGAHGF